MPRCEIFAHPFDLLAKETKSHCGQFTSRCYDSDNSTIYTWTKPQLHRLQSGGGADGHPMDGEYTTTLCLEDRHSNKAQNVSNIWLIRVAINDHFHNEKIVKNKLQNDNNIDPISYWLLGSIRRLWRTTMTTKNRAADKVTIAMICFINWCHKGCQTDYISTPKHPKVMRSGIILYRPTGLFLWVALVYKRTLIGPSNWLEWGAIYWQKSKETKRVRHFIL